MSHNEGPEWLDVVRWAGSLSEVALQGGAQVQVGQVVGDLLTLGGHYLQVNTDR